MSDDHYGPVIGDCEVCGLPARQSIVPHCPKCHGLKPAQRVMRAMSKMLERCRG